MGGFIGGNATTHVGSRFAVARCLRPSEALGRWSSTQRIGLRLQSLFESGKAITRPIKPADAVFVCCSDVSRQQWQLASHGGSNSRPKRLRTRGRESDCDVSDTLRRLSKDAGPTLGGVLFQPPAIAPGRSPISRQECAHRAPFPWRSESDVF